MSRSATHSVRRLLAWAASLTALLCAGAAQADPSSTSIAQGYDLGNVESPRSLAMGGGLAALGSSTVALYQNPASLELTRVYHFEALGAFSPEARRYDGGGAIVDSANGRFGGGIGLNLGMLDPDGVHRSWSDLRIALAYAISDKFSVGITGRYFHSDQHAAAGPFGYSLISSGTTYGPVADLITVDAGLTATPVPGLHIGVVGHNLSDPGFSLVPITVQGGIGYDTRVFAVEADGLADFTTWTTDTFRIMTGGEVFLGEHVPLRAGYRYDQGTNTHALSAGIGYIGRQWSAEFGYRHDIIGEHLASMMSLSLRYFYDATGMLGVQQQDAL